ncbi:MAG: Na+/H+ antiporter NhaA [Candidatus Thiodiazotropha sp. (ex Epidulcina cf. delphinae)]|nr:Na+/H+ antiporter NhaA [Candidatus Thiodiazotropha sp. (ex Epidulcina cf. delphinae)]
MTHQKSKPAAPREKGIFFAPWEKTFDKAFTPFEEFIHRQTTSGLLLMASAILAMVLANSLFADAYRHLVHTPLGVTLGGWVLEKTLHHWVNDGLMALFFFLVGLELKREFLVGELADPHQAALPIVAAIGGMVVPALIYFALNPEGDAARGWGIPMATDIAFAIGALVLLAKRVPKALITFLVALAIVDDLGAVVVIAFFYTHELVWQALALAAVLLGGLVALNLAGIRQPMPYFILGALLWLALLKSGVHATLAGVLTAFTIPARPKYDPELFGAHVKTLMARFDVSHKPGESIMTNDALRAVTHALEKSVRKVETPLQRLEHGLHLPVAFLVIPVFALINAGIPIDMAGLGATLAHPVTLGVGLGLVLGKFIGIAGACWLALRLGIGELPAGTRFTQIAGVALLGGIGFTMAIFIAELGFEGQPEYLLMTKTGVLIASLLAGVSGFFWLWLAGRDQS